MDVKKKKLRLSINKRLVNKNERNDKLAFKEGWQNCELTATQLARHVEEGFAYSVQYAGGVRKSANFLGSDVVSVDIDGSRTVDDALSDPFCQAHLTIMYVTKSHTAQVHRFRLVFALEETITDRTQFASVSRALALKLAGDGAAVDAARICFGSDLGKAEVLDGFLDKSAVDELLANFKNQPRADTEGGGAQRGVAVVRSDKRLDPSTEVVAADGRRIALRSVDRSVSILCPFHLDREPSAFVALNERGSTFLHCSVCNTTWWMQAANPRALNYEFDSFEKYVHQAMQAGGGDPTSKDRWV